MGHILQKTSICGMNISDTLSFTSYATILFLQHFDIMIDDKYYPRERGALGKVDTLISYHVSGVNVINAVL